MTCHNLSLALRPRQNAADREHREDAVDTRCGEEHVRGIVFHIIGRQSVLRVISIVPLAHVSAKDRGDRGGRA